MTLPKTETHTDAFVALSGEIVESSDLVPTEILETLEFHWPLIAIAVVLAVTFVVAWRGRPWR